MDVGQHKAASQHQVLREKLQRERSIKQLQLRFGTNLSREASSLTLQSNSSDFQKYLQRYENYNKSMKGQVGESKSCQSQYQREEQQIDKLKLKIKQLQDEVKTREAKQSARYSALNQKPALYHNLPRNLSNKTHLLDNKSAADKKPQIANAQTHFLNGIQTSRQPQQPDSPAKQLSKRDFQRPPISSSLSKQLNKESLVVSKYNMQSGRGRSAKENFKGELIERLSKVQEKINSLVRRR